MAVHLSIGRIRSVSLAVSLVVLVGLAAVSGAVHFLIHPSPEVETVPGPRSAAVAPRADGQVETKTRHDTELAHPTERTPDADRIMKASSGDQSGQNSNEPAASRPAASEPTLPQGQVTVARRVVEPRDLVAPPTPVAPRNLVEPGSQPKNMAPIPVRAPRRANAGTTERSARTLFERGAEIKLKKDAKVYITSRNIPENDSLLKAYSVDKAAESSGDAAPGLLGIATQAYRTEGAAGTANKTYSLADAMRDAVWRKKTAAKLKTLMTARNTCADGEDDSTRAKPSIGLGNTC